MIVSKLEKIVLSLILTAAPFLKGCANSNITYVRDTHKKHVVETGLVSIDEIRLNHDPDIEINDPNLLIEASEDYSNILDFKRKYQELYSKYCQRVISRLEDESFSSADSAVKELASLLEKDPNPYAQKYLKQIKAFSYVIYVESELVEKTSLKKSAGEVVGEVCLKIIATPMAFVADVASLSKCLDPNTYSYEAFEYTGMMLKPFENAHIPHHDTVLEKTVDKIRICPFSGERTVLEQNIPFSRVQQEVESLK